MVFKEARLPLVKGPPVALGTHWLFIWEPFRLWRDIHVLATHQMLSHDPYSDVYMHFPDSEASSSLCGLAESV